MKLKPEYQDLFNSKKLQLQNDFNDYCKTVVNTTGVEFGSDQLNNVDINFVMKAIVLDSTKVEKDEEFTFLWNPSMDPNFKLLEKQLADITNRKSFVRFKQF